MAYNSDWLFQSHSEKSLWHVEGTSFNFVANACKVSENMCHERDIFCFGYFQRFTIIEWLIISKPLCIGFDEVSKLVHDLGSFPCTHFSPLSIIECILSSLDGIINILDGCSDGLAYYFLSGWVIYIKFLPALGIDKLAIDEKLALDLLEFACVGFVHICIIYISGNIFIFYL